MTRKRQITIPAEIQRAVGAQEGDQSAVSLSDSGTSDAHLHPARSVAELTFGALSSHKRPVDSRALREAFKEAIVEKETRMRLKTRRRREQ